MKFVLPRKMLRKYKDLFLETRIKKLRMGNITDAVLATTLKELIKNEMKEVYVTAKRYITSGNFIGNGTMCDVCNRKYSIFSV